MNKSTFRKINISIISLTLLVAVTLYFDNAKDNHTNDTNKYSENSVADFFDGEVIRWIIPNKPGGGYDEYARLMVPYIEKYTGAHVQIRNFPGAGGLRGVSELFKSPADGLSIALINGSGLVTSRIAGVMEADHEIDELSFLARAVADTRVLAISSQSNYSSFTDILNTEEKVRIGATGLGGSTYVDAVITRNLFALNMDIIHGFDNSANIRHEMLRGSLDGMWSSWGSVFDAVVAGQIKLVLQSGRTRADFLPDVPTVFEFTGKTTDSLLAESILDAWEILIDVGRLIVAPPGMLPDKRNFLREAFRQTLHDPQFLNEAARADRPIAFASGEEVDDITNRALRLPEEVKQFFTEAVHSGLSGSQIRTNR